MATHFICQATEPLPHRFPTSRAPERGHGAVSQYELLNLSDKAHCRFPPPGWDMSESSEDSLPLYRAPAPSWKISSQLIGPDPDLCVTPEKSVASKIISQHGKQFSGRVPTEDTRSTLVDHELDLTLTPEKALDCQNKDPKSNLRNGSVEDGKFKGQHRVRFELDNSKCSSEGGEDSFLFPRSGPAKPYKPTSYTDHGVTDLENLRESDSNSKSQKKHTQFTVKTSNKGTVYVPLNCKGRSHDVKLANHFDENVKTQDDLETIHKQEHESGLPEVVYSTQSDSKPVCHIQNHKATQGTKIKSKDMKKRESDSRKDEMYIKGQGDSAPKRKVKVKRETADQPTDYNYPFTEGIQDTLEYEHVFNRPEYNSTLRIRTELQQIKDSEVDIAKALEKKLRLSDSKKTEITEKVCIQCTCSKLTRYQ